MLSFRNTSEHWDISGDNPRYEGNDPNGMMNTKVSVYITTVLVLVATLMCYATAEEMNTLNSPGQQIAPGMTNDSPQGGMNDNGSTDNYKNGQQGGGQNSQSSVNPTNADTQNIQTGQNPGPGQQATRPVSTATPQPTIREPQKSTPAAPTPDTTHKDVIKTSQPTQVVQEPEEFQRQPVSTGPDGQYHSIQFPPSYPAVKADQAAIQVTSNPAGAGVYLDGIYKGVTPSSGYFIISDLSPGTYAIHLTLSGYTDYPTRITLSRNEVATISADLTSTYVPSEYGALSVQSTPSGADVFLDNEYKGITPVTLQKINTGSHTILIKNEGFSSYNGDVYIVPDQASALSVTLTASVTQTQTPTAITTQPPAPAPTKSAPSPWIAICSLAGAGLFIAGQRIGR